MTVATGPGWELHLGRWQDVLADVQCDVLISDPPYGERTHAGQRHGRKDPNYSNDSCLTGNGLDYAHFTPGDVTLFVGTMAPRVRGWFCVLTSHDLVQHWTASLESAGRYVFAPLACVQSGMNVRLAGDGPSNWTCWLVVSRPRSLPFSKWGTLPGAYITGQDQERKRGEYVLGGKPVGLMRSICRDYSRPGDLVCDPFSGAATTLLAAVMEGRRAIGAEMDPKHFEIARKRLESAVITPPLFVEGPKMKQGALL